MRRPVAVALELLIDHRVGPLAQPGDLLGPFLHLGGVGHVRDELDRIPEGRATGGSDVDRDLADHQRMPQVRGAGCGWPGGSGPSPPRGPRRGRTRRALRTSRRRPRPPGSRHRAPSPPSGRPVLTAIAFAATGRSNASVKWSVPEASRSEAKNVPASPSNANWRICPDAVPSVVSMRAAGGGSASSAPGLVTGIQIRCAR